MCSMRLVSSIFGALLLAAAVQFASPVTSLGQVPDRKAANQALAEIAGRWRCDRFCRMWDTGASIAIDGDRAACTNEVNEVSEGRLLTGRSVRCFGIVGQLADDNDSIQWSDGNLWRRDHRTAF